MSAAALTILIGEQPIDLAALEVAYGRRLRATLSDAAIQRVTRGRQWVEELAARDDAVYGVNTGFGHLRRVRIPRDKIEQLQENLVLSHAVGVGPPVAPEIVRWMLWFKAHMLARGHSGIRVETLRLLCDFLNHDLLPLVPSRGSLGASGDLAPLAHMALPLIGRGEFRSLSDASSPARTTAPSLRRADMPGRAVEDELRRAGLASIRLAAKEGLALLNGTQFMSAHAAHVAVRARRIADLADLISCMSLEGLAGSVRPADPRLHELRPHPGARTTAANIRRHLTGSEILASHANCDRVQDPYSLRCVPQVHGAFRDALAHFTETLLREVNSVTDNPILFDNEAISGGNFHGAPLALVLDYLAIALTDLASISERRVYLLLCGGDGLPGLLMKDTGLNSGFMLPQYTAAALVTECKVLSHPASVDSIPTSLGQEDHVSMGATAAVKCLQVLENVETVLAIEMMSAAQAIDFRAPLRPGEGPRAAHELVRRAVTHADADRLFGDDIAASLQILRSPELLEIAGRST